MNTSLTENNLRQHTLKSFDVELNLMQAQVADMVGLVMYQLDQTMQALHDADMAMALKVVERDFKLDQYETQIDNTVIQVLARHFPVANDLRIVISVSKIAYELEKMGDEITYFAKLVSKLFDPTSSNPNPKLLADIVKIGDLVRTMLTKLLLALDKHELAQAYLLLQYDRECEIELEEGIRHQLSFILHDARLIHRAMDVMQIMKTLERCGEHSKNIAEYIVFMLEGVDIRHFSAGSMTN
ncbi:MAG: phosphate signaling complex protein PhoU [Methylomonas lenta]|nr:phosphate signaling complex protein PhoU [Methylomonas lenta]